MLSSFTPEASPPMLHSYPPDLTTWATPLALSSQRALPAVNNRLTFLQELSASRPLFQLRFQWPSLFTCSGIPSSLRPLPRVCVSLLLIHIASGHEALPPFQGHCPLSQGSLQSRVPPQGDHTGAGERRVGRQDADIRV